MTDDSYIEHHAGGGTMLVGKDAINLFLSLIHI